MEKIVRITCKTNDYLSISEIENFQGSLKITDEERINKLKQSIIKFGFSFPLFVWNHKLLDGHQRMVALKELISNDNYTIENDKVPVVYIEAENEKNAAEKLLLINSKYADLDQVGFELFIEQFEVDIEQLESFVEIDEISFSQKENESNNEESFKDIDEKELKNVCPKCGYEFD